jgi:molybdenum cofactor cytidylyltransferase
MVERWVACKAARPCQLQLKHDMSRGIVGILLAAGNGSRFGGDKLRYCLDDGTPLGVAAAVNLRPACEYMTAVLRPNDDELASLLTEAGCEIIFCAEACKGMGHSLAAGVGATADASAWIVALGDMPFIRTATHQAVAESLKA